MMNIDTSRRYRGQDVPLVEGPRGVRVAVDTL